MLGNELLVVDTSFIWATLVILIPLLFFLVILFRIVRSLFKSREIVGGNALAWILIIGLLFVFLLGIIGLFLHPFLPAHPWRMLVLRDFLFRYGLFWGFGFVFLLLPIRLAIDPVRRKQVFSSSIWSRLDARHRIGLFLFIAIPVVFGWGGGKDVADFFQRRSPLWTGPSATFVDIAPFPPRFVSRKAERWLFPTACTWSTGAKGNIKLRSRRTAGSSFRAARHYETALAAAERAARRGARRIVPRTTGAG